MDRHGALRRILHGHTWVGMDHAVLREEFPGAHGVANHGSGMGPALMDLKASSRSSIAALSHKGLRSAGLNAESSALVPYE